MELLGGLDTEVGIVVRVHRSHFTASGQDLEGDDSIKKLAKDLFERNVDRISVRSMPELSEVRAMAELISADPSEVEDVGGPRAFLFERGCMSFEVVPRELKIAGKDESTTEELLEDLPELLRLLVRGDPELARRLEESRDPTLTLERLEEMFQGAVGFGISRSEAYSSVALTTATMDPNFRSSVVGAALDRNDDFSLDLLAQLSDSDLTQDLSQLAKQIGTGPAFKHAVSLMERSVGRREEMAATLARKMEEAGISRHEIDEGLAQAPIVASLADSLTKTDIAEVDFDVSDLKAEAEAVPAGLGAGIPLMATLLKTEGLSDAAALIDSVEDSVRRWIVAGEIDVAVTVLAAMSEASEDIEDPARKARLEGALRAGVTPELISNLLGPNGGDDLRQHLLSALRERTIPALIERLGEEKDATRRRTLVNMLAQVASNDISTVARSLRDERWYLVRNVVTILGRTENPEAVTHLLKAANHGDARVRKEVMRALHTADDARAARVIAGRLNDRDHSVRMAAVAALAGNRGASAVSALKAFLGTKPQLEDAKSALRSLAYQQDEEADTYLRKIARRWWPPTSRTRQLARYARGVIGNNTGNP